MEKTPEFYKYYPMLFERYFKFSNQTTLKILSKAGFDYYNAVLCLDDIIDNKNFNKISRMLAFQGESIKLLTHVFGVNSQFWNFWDERKKEYFEATKIEKSFLKKKNVDFESYKDLADKKSAFGKIAIDSLFVLDKREDKKTYNSLIKSHKYFSIGFQLYDDVKDFKEDFKNGQFNFAIFKLQKLIDFDQYNQNLVTLHKLLFVKKIAQKILAKSIEQFEKSIEILSNLNTKSTWLKTVVEIKKTIEGYLEITNGYMATIEAKVKLKSHQGHTHSFFEYEQLEDLTVAKALDFIEFDFNQNYVDLKHVMFLGKFDGFYNNNPIHVSDIFQRAILNDCFISVAKKYGFDISVFLKNECSFIVNLRNKDNIGGWSYFPTVQEIAADIDDLGQILQLFTLSKNSQLIERYCSKTISIALKECVTKNGGIETWIIPKENQTNVQKRQEHFNTTKWGKGPDVEVVANFIYSLMIVNKKGYEKVIKNAISYILKQQNDKGYWESRWYYGKWYGTYVCLRLLKEYENIYKKEIKKALEYITKKQNIDFGYSVSKKDESDPLSTAFVVLSLKLYAENNMLMIDNAIMYLISNQNQDGSWRAVDFIRPKASDPYRSKTLTTGYVLKAICS